ncbi:MAG: PilC/PilY family type IV pilus protein [Methylococcales bacterium]|nr:PilC/PilY family type IV pilus protein [Methylococcales bacterium]
MKTLKITLLLVSLSLSVDIQAATSFTPESQPTGWVAAPGLTNVDISSGTESVFRLNYNKNTWSGEIFAKSINTLAVPGSTGPWDPNTAATLLNTLNYDTGRKIVTRNGNTNVPYRWASLSTTQQTSLGTSTTGPNILNYVRGDHSNEEPSGASYRARQIVLGDILHSNLHFWKHNATTKRLYVGANDGMLHVFNADTGAEVFAYIPSMVIPNLKLLTSKPYGHTYFVDGGIAIANATLSGSLKTVLVGGLGAGGKGLYALDITNPSPSTETAAASAIKWEITPTTTGFGDLGYTFGTPRIGKLNDGTTVAIVGNGYMNGGTGHAVLYLINLDTGVLVKAIDTGSGSTASPNGLSTPTLYDGNSDGKVDYAYAGDLDGHLWKFDLSGNAPANYSAPLLFTTSPVRAITTAPAVAPHSSGGRMVAFATGRTLTSGDLSDTAVNYAYGIWDGAPVSNSTLLTQTLSTTTFGSGSVRTITANVPDWTSGHHYGWQVALPAGERVVGETPFVKDGRFWFVSTNPTITHNTPPNGDNWLNELVFETGGSPSASIFDLNDDGDVNSSDLADACSVAGIITCVAVSKAMDPGVLSQPTYVLGSSFSSALFTTHPDTTAASGNAAVVDDPGVSGGHFDFDNYYYAAGATTTTITPTNLSQTKTICATETSVANDLNTVSTNFCTSKNGFSSGYTFLSAYVTGGTDKNCKKSGKKYQTITCNTTTSTTNTTLGNYQGPYPQQSPKQPQLHVHEYDDIYDVTGVNMLNASDTRFNLSNAISSTSTPFKILLMNQYLNPAAKISVGGATYESVKTYKDLASQTSASTLLSGLPIYTRANVSTLIVNLPLDAFIAKDWWGDGATIRAGLIPTVYSCVCYVNADGSMVNSNGRGLIGPNGERFDGALTIQLIKDTTPESALELNHSGGDVKYGWRVKLANFKTYVLAEYTIYWHHPNGKCYGQTGWVAAAPQDPVSDATPGTKATGSTDPTDGIFTGGFAVSSVVVITNGNTTTTTTTYTDGGRYIKVVVTNNDGSTTTTQTMRNGTVVVSTTGSVGVANSSLVKSPNQSASTTSIGRQSWWEMF